jgi:hypothetical protein
LSHLPQRHQWRILSALLDLLDALSAFESPNVFNPWREPDSPDVPQITTTLGRLALHRNCDPGFLPKS